MKDIESSNHLKDDQSEEMEETFFWVVVVGGVQECQEKQTKTIHHKWTIPEVEEIRTSEEAQGSSPTARQSPKQEQMRCCLQN